VTLAEEGPRHTSTPNLFLITFNLFFIDENLWRQADQGHREQVL
jgi:hypothetical protein